MTKGVILLKLGEGVKTLESAALPETEKLVLILTY